jgi:hypothetical protein
MKRTLTLAAVAAFLYLAAYTAYRLTHTQVWVGDGKPYVSFWSKRMWYLFRPLTRLDGAVTGIGAHLGPRRDPPGVLLDRAIAAAGGAERLGALRALEWRGRAELAVEGQAPLRITGLWRLQLPDSAIVTTTVDGQPAATARSLIIAGPRGWTRVNKKLAPLAPELIAHERDQFYLYHLMRLVPLRGSAYRLAPLADDALGHKRIRVSHAGRPDVDIAFDTLGTLTTLTDSVTDPQSHTRRRQQVALSGQVDAAGARWPQRIVITWDGKPYFDLTILELKPLATLDDPLLRGVGGTTAPTARARGGARRPRTH